MARSELGTKRVCPTTGRPFYDLNREPIISPYSGDVVSAPEAAYGRGAAPAVARREPVAEVDEPETGEVDLVSLDEAEEEESGKTTDDAAAGTESDDTDDDAFVVAEDDEDADPLVEVEGEDEE